MIENKIPKPDDKITMYTERGNNFIATIIDVAADGSTAMMEIEKRGSKQRLSTELFYSKATGKPYAKYD